MKEYKTLFKLELKARFGTRGVSKPVATAFKILLFTALALLVYALYIFGVNQLVLMFDMYQMSKEFLVLFIALSMLILVVFGISSVIKNLFRSGDNELLMRFPVSAGAVFASKPFLYKTQKHQAATSFGWLPPNVFVLGRGMWLVLFADSPSAVGVLRYGDVERLPDYFEYRLYVLLLECACESGVAGFVAGYAVVDVVC